jgi:hypothetical protein
MILRRREFITLLGSGFVGSSLPAMAQQAKQPTVALVFGGNDISELLGPDPFSPPVRAFVHELRDLGWLDGRTIVIEASHGAMVTWPLGAHAQPAERVRRIGVLMNLGQRTEGRRVLRSTR